MLFLSPHKFFFCHDTFVDNVFFLSCRLIPPLLTVFFPLLNHSFESRALQVRFLPSFCSARHDLLFFLSLDLSPRFGKGGILPLLWVRFSPVQRTTTRASFIRSNVSFFCQPSPFPLDRRFFFLFFFFFFFLARSQQASPNPTLFSISFLFRLWLSHTDFMLFTLILPMSFRGSPLFPGRCNGQPPTEARASFLSFYHFFFARCWLTPIICDFVFPNFLTRFPHLRLRQTRSVVYLALPSISRFFPRSRAVAPGFCSALSGNLISPKSPPSFPTPLFSLDSLFSTPSVPFHPAR